MGWISFFSKGDNSTTTTAYVFPKRILTYGFHRLARALQLSPSNDFTLHESEVLTTAILNLRAIQGSLVCPLKCFQDNKKKMTCGSLTSSFSESMITQI